MSHARAAHFLVAVSLVANSCATPASTGPRRLEVSDGGDLDAGRQADPLGSDCRRTLEHLGSEIAAHKNCATDADCVAMGLHDSPYQCTGVNPDWWSENKPQWRQAIYACIRGHWLRPVCCAVRCISGRCLNFEVKENRMCTPRLNCPNDSACWYPPREHECWRLDGLGVCITATDSPADVR